MFLILRTMITSYIYIISVRRFKYKPIGLLDVFSRVLVLGCFVVSVVTSHGIRILRKVLKRLCLRTSPCDLAMGNPLRLGRGSPPTLNPLSTRVTYVTRYIKSLVNHTGRRYSRVNLPIIYL